MAHIWIAELQASSLARTGTPESIEGILALLLDDREVFSAVARSLGLGEETPGGELELSRWLSSLERPPSAALRAEVMALVGLPASAYELFERSPCELPAAYMERGAWYWMLHNLLAPPEEQIWASALRLRITAFGDNGPPLLEIAAPSTFALRLMVELGVAAGAEREAGPIVDYFRERGDAWPEIAGSEDDAEGIVWAASITPVEGPEPAWTVEATIHPHWLPAITHLPFRSWAY